MNLRESLRNAIEAAGFFITPEEDMGTWRRVTLCSQKSLEGYSGTSCWVAIVHDRIFLGVWSGTVYEINSIVTLIDLVAAWFERDDPVTVPNISSVFVMQFDLTDCSNEFEGLVA